MLFADDGTLDVKGHLLADHHFGEGEFRCVLCFDCADVLALAEDCNSVGHGENLMQLMGDDDNGFAVALHLTHNVEQLFRLLRCENGGRLVED